MNIKELLEEIEIENKSLKSRLNSKICLKDCYKSFKVSDFEETAEIQLNLYTLDIINRDSVPRKLGNEITVAVEDKNFIRNNNREERRAFCEFLLLRYDIEHVNVEFLDRESPDYIIYDGTLKISIEVVEAITTLEAEFRKICRKNFGRNKNLKDVIDYIQLKHKTNGKNLSVRSIEDALILSPRSNFTDTSITREKIVAASLKKVKKYKEYDIVTDKRTILVHFWGMGFTNELDFIHVGRMISESEDISTANIDSIYVVSVLYNLLVEYDNCGNICGVITTQTLLKSNN